MENSDDSANRGQSPANQRFEDSLQALQTQVLNLSASVNTLSGLSTVGNVLEQGFKMFEDHLGPALAAQLAPLRDLGPKRVEVTLPISRAITTVLDAMKRPSLPSIGSLGIQEANVPFIGQGQGVPALPPVPPVPLGCILPAHGTGNVGQPQVAAPSQQALGGGIKP